MLLWLHEGVWDGLSAIHWADEDDRCPTANHQTPLLRVFSQLLGVVRVWEGNYYHYNYPTALSERIQFNAWCKLPTNGIGAQGLSNT